MPQCWEELRLRLGFHLLPPEGEDLDVVPYTEARVLGKALDLIETLSPCTGHPTGEGQDSKAVLLCRGLWELCTRSTKLETLLKCTLTIGKCFLDDFLRAQVPPTKT